MIYLDNNATTPLHPKVKEKIFLDSDPIDQMIKIGHQKFRVVGVMEGRGATFAFDLDVERTEVQAAPASNIESLSDGGLTSNPHILIVDDNATNRVVAQALCEMFGCTSETAVDGVEALESVQQRQFDLILMDIKMPRMDGVQATKAIRALEGPMGAVPIVALTANADPDDAKKYLACGMAAVVEKPIKPERLRMAMNAALSTTQAAADDSGEGDGESAQAPKRRAARRA